MRVVAESHWFWMLYEHEDRRVLYVTCSVGGAGYVDRTIELDAEENAAYLHDGIDFVTTMATAVQNERHRYWNRNVPDFHRDPTVADALTQWRSTHPPAGT